MIDPEEGRAGLAEDWHDGPPAMLLAPLHRGAQQRRWCWLRDCLREPPCAPAPISLHEALPGLDLDTGRFLYLMARLAGARRMLALGSCGGLAAAWLACALRGLRSHEGDRWLICAEPRETDAEMAWRAVSAGCAERYVDIRGGDPLAVCERIDAPLDLVFGALPAGTLLTALGILRPRLRPGALGLLLAEVADPALEAWLGDPTTRCTALTVTVPRSLRLLLWA